MQTNGTTAFTFDPFKIKKKLNFSSRSNNEKLTLTIGEILEKGCKSTLHLIQTKTDATTIVQDNDSNISLTSTFFLKKKKAKKKEKGVCKHIKV